MKRTRLLHIIDAPYEGGAQEVILQLARTIDRSRFSLQVVVLHGEGYFTEQLRELEIPVRSLASRKSDPAVFFRLVAFLRRHRFDLIHTSLFFASLFGIIASVLSLRGHRRFVWIHAHRAQLPWYDFPVYRVLSLCCHRFIAQVPTSVEELLENGIATKKIQLITIGFDPQSLHRTDTDLRAEFGIPRNAPLISRVARFHPDKGVPELIDIMDLVWREVPETWLLLVGGGPQETEIMHKIAVCSRPERIAFAGIRQDLYTITECSDIVACSSSAEGLGMTNLAAVFLGVPVVSYNVGAVALAVDDGENGYLIPPGDRNRFAEKTVQLLTDPLLRKRMGAQGRRIAYERFSIEKMVRELENSYLEVPTRK